MATPEDLVEYPSAESMDDLLPSHVAAAYNNVSELFRLVVEGAELEDPTSKETPLHAAAKSGSLDTLKLLVEKGVVPLEAKSGRGGYTAAHLAAVWGHFQCLKHLLTHDPVKGKALSEMVEDSGLTVVSLAALQGDKEMVLWILEQFPSTAHIPNNNGDQVVHFAAAEGYLDILKMLVERFGNEIVSRENNKLTKPVFFAAKQGKINVLEYLITELGVDPLAKDDMGMCTVHAATQNKMFGAVKWLINMLGPQHILNRTNDGATPLHFAAASGNSDILKFLLDNLEKPVDINVMDDIHATPAYVAAEFGQCSTMVTLLQHRADITIADTDNKTPYEIALEKGEKGHMEVAAMLAEYLVNGSSVLPAYEKRMSHGQREMKRQPSMSTQQEVEELSSVIQKTSEILHRKKEKKLKRQESLNMSNRIGEDEEYDIEDIYKMDHMKMRNPQEKNIAHTLGPGGDFYAVPHRKAYGRGRRAKRVQSQHNSDVEEYMSETMLHHPYGKHYSQHQHLRGPSFGNDPVYATVNYETASSHGHSSQIKHYQDSDSEMSGLTGGSDYIYDGHPQGFYPPGYCPGYPPPLPMHRQRSMIDRATSASSRGSNFSETQSHYGIPAAPMYIGYPQMYHGYPQAGGTMPVPHQQMMQGYGPLGGIAMYRARPMNIRKYHRAQSEASRTKSLRTMQKTKKLKKLPSIPDGKSSQRRSHTDQDMGYGPTMDSTDAGQLMVISNDDSTHLPAPPITSTQMTDATSEVVKFDSNFIMTKPGESVAVRHLGETALNPAKDRSAAYDGRYDQYIMTDSEDEYELDNHYRVGYAAEVACIIAIGCVAGLKGLAMKKKEKKSQNRKLPTEQSSISSAWDMSYHAAEPTKNGGKRNKRNSNSVSEVYSPALQDLSPAEYIGREEAERTTWDMEAKKKKNQNEEKKRAAETEDIQSELLTQDLIKMSYESVSKSLGEKILGETIGARNTSMVNMVVPSSVGPRMSLVSNTDDNDSNFDDTISILHEKNPSQKKIAIDDGDDEFKNLIPDSDEKSKKKKFRIKKKKDKEGREKRGKKEKNKKKRKDKDNSEIFENFCASETDIDPIEGVAEEVQRNKKVMVIREKIASAVCVGEAEISENNIKKKMEEKVWGKGKEEKKQIEKELNGRNEEEKKKKEWKEKETKMAKEKKEREESKERKEKEREEKMERERKEREVKLKKEKERDKERKGKAEKERERLDKLKKEKDKKRSEKEEMDKERGENEKNEKNEKMENEKQEEEKKREREKREKEEHETEKQERDGEKQAADKNGFITAQHNTSAVINTSSMKSPMSTQPIPDNIGIIQDEIPSTIPGPSSSGNGMLPDDESRKQRKLEAEEASISEYYADTTQLGFSDISAWEDEMCNFSEEEKNHDHSYIKSSTPHLDEGILEGITGYNNVSQEGYGGSHAAQKMRRVGEGGVINMGVQFTCGNGQGKVSMHSVAVDGSGVKMCDTDGQGTASMQYTGSQAGAGYSSSFEERVMSILKSMEDRMQQMKSNPMVMQREIHEQEQLQRNMIQKIISMSLDDSEVMKILLVMLDKQNKENASSLSESMVFEELQSKLLSAHEEQRKVSKVQLQTQVDFQTAIQKKLDEQTQQQEMGLHTYAKKMEEHWLEYEKKWEEFENFNRQKKEEENTKEKAKHRSHGKYRHNMSHASSSSESDEGLVWVSSTGPKPKLKSAKFSGIKTMQATIIQQELLSSDDLKTNSQISVEKIKETQEARAKLLRKNTIKKLDDTQQAMLRFESEHKGDDDDDELLQFQHVHPITLKRARIKFQDGSDCTHTNSRDDMSQGKVGCIIRVESGVEQLNGNHGHQLKQQPDKDLAPDVVNL